jgi:Na+/H+-dicarboxylate symporter
MAFSLLFGVAAGKSRIRGAESLAGVLVTVYQACLQLTQWFNLLLPLVLFAIIASQIARTGLEPLRAMTKFVAALALGSTLLALASLAALRLVTRRSWSDVLRSQRESMFMAIATRNTAACMPTMITSLVETLGFDRNRVELLVPLGISMLRAGQAFYYVVATLFLAQLYEVHLSLFQLGVVVAGSILTGFASSGMSGVIILSLTGLVCTYLKVPFEAALALFVAVDPICDMLRTLVGVVGNNAFAAMAAGRPAAIGG